MGSFLLLAALAGADPAPALRIEAGADPAAATITARLPAAVAARLPAGIVPAKDGEGLLRFVLVPATGTPGGAILGTYTRTDTTLAFVPRFRLTPGERYRATLALDDTAAHAEYRVPAKPPAPPAAVAAVYPTAAELPANLLKFYLHFSTPMREGPAVFDHLRLLDDAGEAVEDPWRRTELWNADATRLTLWIHPGRIKEGVNLRDDLGPVLEPNRRYTLVVSESLPDAEGRSLGAAFKKAFRTTAAVRTAVEVKDWTVTAPKPGTRDPVEVRFPRPLDRALLARALAVTDAAGKPVAGAIAVADAERAWSFTPARPWAAGDYAVAADDRLEDLAGNRLLRPFDLDLDAPARKDPPRTRAFRVGK